MKITKSKLKELVRQSIFETIPQKKDKKEAPPQQKGGNDDTAEKTNIEIGKRNFGKVSVISGLNEGDVVIAEGVSKVRDKAKVKIVTPVK